MKPCRAPVLFGYFFVVVVFTKTSFCGWQEIPLPGIALTSLPSSSALQHVRGIRWGGRGNLTKGDRLYQLASSTIASIWRYVHLVLGSFGILWNLPISFEGLGFSRRSRILFSHPAPNTQNFIDLACQFHCLKMHSKTERMQVTIKLLHLIDK